MTREFLEAMDEFRGKFTGIFERYGTKPGYYKPDVTILIKDITDSTGNIVADHLWFNYTKGFKNVGELNTNDVIEFVARVTPYVKGYVNNKECIDDREIDYRLSHPTKIVKLKNV